MHSKANSAKQRRQRRLSCCRCVSCAFLRRQRRLRVRLRRLLPCLVDVRRVNVPANRRQSRNDKRARARARSQKHEQQRNRFRRSLLLLPSYRCCRLDTTITSTTMASSNVTTLASFHAAMGIDCRAAYSRRGILKFPMAPLPAPCSSPTSSCAWTVHTPVKQVFPAALTNDLPVPNFLTTISSLSW